MHEWIMMACDLYNSRLTSVLQLCSTLSDDDQCGHYRGSHTRVQMLLIVTISKVNHSQPVPSPHCRQERGRSRYTLKISIRPQPFSTSASDLFWENGAHKVDLRAALPPRMRGADGCGQIFHNRIWNIRPSGHCAHSQELGNQKVHSLSSNHQ